MRQRQFSEVDSELQNRQFLLDGERNPLEDQMRREFIDRQVDAENARVAITEKIAFIMETEFVPLEAQIAVLELELEELYANERSLQLELRKLKAELGDAERDVETRILDLLDEALSSFTDADIDPTSIRTHKRCTGNRRSWHDAGTPNPSPVANKSHEKGEGPDKRGPLS